MSVCEVVQPALEKLDSDHLSRFGLNWVTVNMHTFQVTILVDPDVQDYLYVCSKKVRIAIFCLIKNILKAVLFIHIF